MFLCVNIRSEYMYVHHMHAWCLQSSGDELQMVVNGHVSAGNEHGPFTRAANAPNCPAIFPAPESGFIIYKIPSYGWVKNGVSL